MIEDAVPLAGPYAHAGSSVGRTMGLVMAALAPATLFGLYRFGWPAIWLFAVTLAGALAAEAHRLEEKNNLGDDDIKQLVDDIGQRIDAERAAWREKLLDRFVTTKVG